ncbi:chromate efflux transporter [Persicobacter diffluens]|uniref:Chromate transporter n=1 Tax=Persicobacter diffluens TaxID=981 RepID=A0AAN4VTI5_9BACT|nr:chromate transporter [Persicobacter diffluens]
MRRARRLIFLRDVMQLAFTAYGGPQAHIALFIEVLIEKHQYLTEEELLELNALCSILPGPTSTQTITAVGFRLGGPSLAYWTLLIWCFPAITLMILLGLLISLAASFDISLAFTRFIPPLAVAFVAAAGIKIARKVIRDGEGVVIMVISVVLCLLAASPFLFPLILLAAGTFTSWRHHREEKSPAEKAPWRIDWKNFFLWIGVLIGAALVGYFTQDKLVRLFENFYRNGSLVFGGGQVLIPLLYTEFVSLKMYLTSEEFLTGYTMVQAVPGPVFSFCAYVGTLSMQQHGVPMAILGGLVSAVGIFLPGTFLIFFVIRFWERLKHYAVIKASLKGIVAASSGFVAAAAVQLAMPIEWQWLNILVVLSGFILILTNKVPAPVIVLLTLGIGLIL